MAGPGGREVGRLNVRVLPNTSNFAQSLQRYLDRIENRAQVKIRAVVNTQALVADMRQSMRELDGRILLPVRLHLDELEVTRLRAELAHLAPPVGIPAHVVSDHSELDALRASVAALGSDSQPANSKLGALLGTLGRLGGTVAKAGMIPGLAGMGAGLAAMVPAAGAAVPLLIGVALASQTLKLGLSGVSDALGGDADAFAKLTPAARAFVTEVRTLGPAWASVKTGVQESLFKGLAQSLSDTATKVLPVLKTGLAGTATALNGMGQGVLATARTMAASGALGTAITGANSGLTNLAKLPALALQAITQLGAAAGPAFAKLTAGAGASLDALSARISAGFNSGGMQRGIEAALGLVRQLLGVLGNVAITLGNVFGPAAAAGGGALAVFAAITKQLAEMTGTAQAQATFKALFETLASVGALVSGVLSSALQATLPLISSLVNILAGPLQQTTAILGPALSGLAISLGTALGPAVAAVAGALAVILPIAAQLIAQLATALGPILVSTGQLFAQLVTILMTALAPILAQLPVLLGPILAALTGVLGVAFDLAGQLLTALAPSLAQIGASVGELLVALSPLLVVLGDVLSKALAALMPLFVNLIGIAGDFAAMMANILSSEITNIVIPVIKMLVSLLQGDFSGAFQHSKEVVSGVKTHFVTILREMSNFISATLARIPGFFGDMASAAWQRIQQLGSDIVSAIRYAMNNFTEAISGGMGTTALYFASLPGRLLGALGNLGSLLLGAGRDLLNGLLRGISEGVEKVKQKLKSVTGMLPDWKGPPDRDKRLLTPNGRLLMRGFQAGITDQLPSLRRQLAGVTGDIPALVGAGPALSLTASGTWSDHPGIDDLVATLRAFAGRDVVVQVGAQEIARASALGSRQLDRR